MYLLENQRVTGTAFEAELDDTPILERIETHLVEVLRLSAQSLRRCGSKCEFFPSPFGG